MEAQLNGLSLFYTDTGPSSKPPIIFIHGFPFDHTMWASQMKLAETYFRVIAYDLRGHGKSGVGNGQYIFEEFVDDLLALLDHLTIKNAILCGLSTGGYIALRTVERQPERVRGLILCDTRSEADSQEGRLKRAVGVKTIKTSGKAAYIEGFLKILFAASSWKERPKVIESVRAMMTQNSTEGICGTLIALATRTDTSAYLPQIKAPTLILVGQEDAVTPPSAAIAMKECIPGSILEIVPNSGHMSNLENQNFFNAKLESYFKSL